MIPQSFIDGLVARADIVELIGTRVQLKKVGREFSACCPFHGEKTPSFFVSPQKQFYHCFGCGAHGTVLRFLMEYDHLEFVEAVHQLAERFGLDVPSDGRSQPLQDQGALDTVAQAAAYYRAQLQSHPPAIDYLKNRGVDGKTAAEFGLGYAPAGWDGMSRLLGGHQQAQKRLLDAGLVIARDGGGVHDRFRDRLMFPIRDQRGRTIAFGGRILGDGKPKYLNSPETELFHKSRELYGFFEARQALRHIPRLLVVEGYMDVIMLAQHGIRYAVATLGTATTADHLRRLFRLTPEVVFCFDGDRAGRAAAWRALENVLPEAGGERELRFLFLPEGEDPDSLVRSEGTSQFQTRIESAATLSTYLLEQLAAQVDLSDPHGRTKLAHIAQPLIARIPDKLYREVLLGELARRVRMTTDGLARLLRTAGAPNRAGHHSRPTGAQTTKPTPMQRAIAMLVKQPALAAVVEDAPALAKIDVPGMPLLVELIEFIHQRPQVTTGGILEHWRGRADSAALETLATRQFLTPEAGFKDEFAGQLRRFRARQRDARFETLRRTPLSELTAAEKAELRTLSEQ